MIENNAFRVKNRLRVLKLKSLRVVRAYNEKC